MRAIYHNCKDGKSKLILLWKILSEGEKKRRRLLSNPKLHAILQTFTSLIAELGCVEEVDLESYTLQHLQRLFWAYRKISKVAPIVEHQFVCGFSLFSKDARYCVDRPSEVLVRASLRLFLHLSSSGIITCD